MYSQTASFGGTITPVNNEIIPHDSGIAVTGWGHANSPFVIKIYVDEVLRANHAGQAGPEENVVENVAPPASTNVWTYNLGNTSGSYGVESE